MLGIGKLLGLNKKSDYYLELDEAKGNGSAPPKAEPKPEAPKAEKVEAPKAEKKTQKTAKKAPKAEKAPAAPAAVPSKPAPEPPPLNQGLSPTPAGMTFATDYLLPKATPTRRRPGPSMNLFKDMARQVSR
ncbi:MAG: hypothetical protein ACP5D7_20260 [Limnospira sp.]